MTRSLLCSLAAVAVMSCSRDKPPASAATTTTSATPGAVESPAAALERIDTRAPVPLLPVAANNQKQNMRGYLTAVQEIVSALATDDFAAIEHATERLGFSDRIVQVCAHMGEAAPGLTEQCLDFHHTADRIATGAREHDRSGILKELGATLRTCTAWPRGVEATRRR